MPSVLKPSPRDHVGTLFEDYELDAIPVLAQELLRFNGAESHSPCRGSDEEQERWPIHASLRELARISHQPLVAVTELLGDLHRI